MVKVREQLTTQRISIATKWWTFPEGVEPITRARQKTYVAQLREIALSQSPKSRTHVNRAFSRVIVQALWQPVISSNFAAEDIKTLFLPVFQQLGIPAAVDVPDLSGHLAGVVHLLSDGRFLARDCRLFADVVTKLDRQHRELVIVKDLRELKRLPLWPEVLPLAVKTAGVNCSLEDAFCSVIGVSTWLDRVFSTFHVLTTQYENVIATDRKRSNEK